MSAKSAHPLYSAMLDKWQLGNDSYEGEDAIKEAGAKYLTPTSGQVADGATGSDQSEGSKAYQAYKMRAFYPDIFKDAVEAAIGIMHREPPKIDLPESMEYLRDNCTALNESCEQLLRKINAKQLTTGRLGLLGDIVIGDDKKAMGQIAIYEDVSIRNWSESSDLGESLDVDVIILDESDFQMDADFKWIFKNEYRILALVDDAGGMDKDGKYGSAVFEDSDEIGGAIFQKPSVSGTEMESIPFVFVNSKDLAPSPDQPPLHGLAKACLAIYRAEADYRQSLFMQGQDTLVRIGMQGDTENDVVRTGAGAKIDVPIGGDVKYVGVSSNGLPEQRSSLENDYNRAYQKSGQLVDATSRAKESGDALRIRVAAQTATLPQIAFTGAAALQKVLRDLAKWVGADPEKVVVTPNQNFSEADLNGKTLVEMVQAKGLSAPLSDISIHDWMRKQGFTDLTYEEEISNIESEVPAQPVIPSPADAEE